MKLKIPGEPILAALKDEWMFGVGSMIFLAIFFCPRDLVYKLVQLKLISVVICIYNEILRANKVYKGLEEGKSAMPAEGSVFFIPVLIAILKVHCNTTYYLKRVLLEKNYIKNVTFKI